MKDKHEREYLAFVGARLPWLRRVAFLLAQDWHRADDLVQVAITRLYVHWHRARAAQNLDGYARRVLVNAFLGERRSRWASLVQLRPALPEAAVSDVDTDTRLTVQAALAKVPPRQRAVLVLRYHCDLSVAETAEILGCSTGTVKSQTSHGLATLRRLLSSPAPTNER